MSLTTSIHIEVYELLGYGILLVSSLALYSRCIRLPQKAASAH